MRHDSTPFYLAAVLVAGCVIFRLLSSAFPESIPNVSPLMALAYVGAMYLPRGWGWLVGPVALVMTDAAFLQVNYLTDGSGSMFSVWTFLSLALYAGAGGLGIWLARGRWWPGILGGSVVCSLLFYVASNTFSWWYDGWVRLAPGYAGTWAGWWQANWAGLPGYAPTWVFLRNGMAGDLFFTVLLLLALDRGLFFGVSREQASARASSDAAAV